MEGDTMSVVKYMNVSFTLLGITSTSKPTEPSSSFEILLKLSIQDKGSISYVAFVFHSIDLMYLSLKSLAKSVQAFSIDSLRFHEYNATIKIEEKLNEPDHFISFILPNHLIWPAKKCYTHFLYDFPE